MADDQQTTTDHAASDRVVVQKRRAALGSSGIRAVSHEDWCDLRSFAKREDIRHQQLRSDEESAFEIAQSGCNSEKEFAQTPTHYEVELSRRVNELSVEQRTHSTALRVICIRLKKSSFSPSGQGKVVSASHTSYVQLRCTCGCSTPTRQSLSVQSRTELRTSSEASLLKASFTSRQCGP